MPRFDYPGASPLRRAVRWAAPAILAAVLVSAGSAGAAVTDLTYYGRVSRLMQTECMSCHHTGGLAPFSMENYDAIRPYLTSIRIYVANRMMPPWNARAEQGFTGGQGFVPDRVLSQEQIDLITQWVDAGGPAGDPADAPPSYQIKDWEIGTPDVELELPVTYTMTGSEPDDYRCFVLKTNFTQDTVVTGMEVQPGNKAIAHHAILFLDPQNQGPARDAAEGDPTDGYTCYGGPMVTGALGLGGWAPGSNIQPFNSRVGVVIPRGSNIIMQMHYHANGTNASDRSKVGLKLSQSSSIMPLFQIIPVDLGMAIPPSTAGYGRNMSFDVSASIHLLGVLPHMHTLGRTMKATVRLPSGQTLPLIDIGNWDFNWQNYYIYKDPIAIPAGSRITFDGTFDNYTPNWVYGGEATNEEMLGLGMAFTLDSNGAPPTPDSTPPRYASHAVGFPGIDTQITVNFTEPIQNPTLPYDVSLTGPSGNVPINGISVSAAALNLIVAGLEPVDYTLTLRGFYGIKDLAGHFLDGDGDGEGGEIGDDKTIVFNGARPPAILRQTAAQVVNAGDDVLMAVEAGGQGPFSHQWRRNGTALSGKTASTLSLPNVTTSNSGTYRCDVTNASGMTPSANALLSVLAIAQGPSAELVRMNVPAQMLPGQTAGFSVTYKNTGTLTWHQAQGVGLAEAAGDEMLASGMAASMTDPLIVVARDGEYTFEGILTAPSAPGAHLFSAQMIRDGSPFGPLAQATIEVGTAFGVDFAAGSAGWTGAALAGGVNAQAGPGGLCMTVPGPGDNIVGWVSPERYIPLIDGKLYRAKLDVATDQQAPDAIPLLNFIYSNFNSSGLGNNFGGESWFLDVDGGAAGIGRPAGRNSFSIYFAPNAWATPQWRGVVDPANGAFDPAADSFNDIGLLLRVLDLGSGNVNSGLDSGSVCVRNLRIDAYDEAGLVNLGIAWAPPINSATHLAEAAGQGGGGSASIDDGLATAFYELAPSGAGSRKSLLPFNPAEDNGVNLNRQLFPARWWGNALYRGTAFIRSNVSTGSEGSDPVDSIFLIFDTPTVELGQTHYTTRGAPGNMHRAASPRLASTAGGTQRYQGYFSTHNITLSATPDADRFRLYAEFFNTPDIGPDGQGTDPFAVELLMLEALQQPD